MANHFPTIPTLNLYGIIYTAWWSGDFAAGYLQHLDGFDVSGVQPMDDVLGPQMFDTASPILNLPFFFTTPGDPGSFDQDAQEAAVASVLDDVAQAVATASGQTLADIQAAITVKRQWIWQDSSGQFTLQYNGDTMTYPA